MSHTLWVLTRLLLAMVLYTFGCRSEEPVSVQESSPDGGMSEVDGQAAWAADDAERH